MLLIVSYYEDQYSFQARTLGFIRVLAILYEGRQATSDESRLLGTVENQAYSSRNNSEIAP